MERIMAMRARQDVWRFTFRPQPVLCVFVREPIRQLLRRARRMEQQVVQQACPEAELGVEFRSNADTLRDNVPLVKGRRIRTTVRSGKVGSYEAGQIYVMLGRFHIVGNGGDG